MRTKSKARRSPYGAVSGDFEPPERKVKKRKPAKGVSKGRVQKERLPTATKNAVGRKKVKVDSGGNSTTAALEVKGSNTQLRRSTRNRLAPTPKIEHAAESKCAKETSKSQPRRSPRNHQPTNGKVKKQGEKPKRTQLAGNKSKNKRGTQGVSDGRVKKNDKTVADNGKKNGSVSKKMQSATSGGVNDNQCGTKLNKVRLRRSARNRQPGDIATKTGANTKKASAAVRKSKSKRSPQGAVKRKVKKTESTVDNPDDGGPKKKLAKAKCNQQTSTGDRELKRTSGGGSSRNHATVTSNTDSDSSYRGSDTLNTDSSYRGSDDEVPEWDADEDMPQPDADEEMPQPDADEDMSEADAEAQMPDWGPCVACNSHDKLNRPLDKDLYRLLRKWRLNFGLSYVTAVGDRATLPSGTELKGQYMCTGCTTMIGKLLHKVRNS